MPNNTVDPNEAPEGYVAIAGRVCEDCAVYYKSDSECDNAFCTPKYRKDRQEVIFTAKK